MTVLLLTGRPTVGKTTVIRKVAEALPRVIAADPLGRLPNRIIGQMHSTLSCRDLGMPEELPRPEADASTTPYRPTLGGPGWSTSAIILTQPSKVTARKPRSLPRSLLLAVMSGWPKAKVVAIGEAREANRTVSIHRRSVAQSRKPMGGLLQIGR